jgi:hypothetical protein
MADRFGYNHIKRTTVNQEMCKKSVKNQLAKIRYDLIT